HSKQLGVYIEDRWEKKARQWKWEEEASDRREAMAKKERAKAITRKINGNGRYFPPGELFFKS
ncbi:MAG: hypothetical protein KAJ55_03365, partial [Anaerolineales bacterium]|nr:hypothetical protein [Anaerolineales bacterium]